MPTNIYVDTNIIIDICDINRVTHKSSLSIIREYGEKDELFINSDSLSTLFYVLKNRVKLSLKESLERVYFIHNIFKIVPIDESISLQALELCTQNICADYEDALQYTCAQEIDATIIVTNDKKFISKDIKIVSTI